MVNRNLLNKQLIKAWEKTIKGPYENRLINSEHGLQVHFCIALFETFQSDGTQRTIFVEPTLILDKRRIPDLVICNANQVIGVIELKYAPRGLPEYEKDIETLCKVKEASKDLKLTNERFRGSARQLDFTVAEDLVLCWAAVHDDRPLPSGRQQKVQQLEGHYLELRAITSPSEVFTVVGVGTTASNDRI